MYSLKLISCYRDSEIHSSLFDGVMSTTLFWPKPPVVAYASQ